MGCAWTLNLSQFNNWAELELSGRNFETPPSHPEHVLLLIYYGFSQINHRKPAQIIEKAGPAQLLKYGSGTGSISGSGQILPPI